MDAVGRPLGCAAELSRDKARGELYFQNPQFGFRLLHLVVARLQSTEGGVTPRY